MSDEEWNINEIEIQSIIDNNINKGIRQQRKHPSKHISQNKNRIYIPKIIGGFKINFQKQLTNDFNVY